MHSLTRWSRLTAAVAILGIAGCKSLEVTNPNAPDAVLGLSDPGAVEGLVTGAMRNWVQTRQSYDASLVLSAMADSYTASWNNFNLRYYTSYNVECPNRCGWDNASISPFRFEIETYWYGYYGVLSSVNDALRAIRIGGLELGDEDNTAMHEAVAVMLQGAVYANIALAYDKGFAPDETDDVSTFAGAAALPLYTRQELRDKAIEKFDEAIALMTATPFSSTPSTWLGAVNGPTYSSAQLIKLMNTMKAEVVAFFGRTESENLAANWAQVKTFASAGMSTGTPFDFEFFQDNVNMVDGVKNWSNDMTTMRVDTRLAHILTNGPNPALIHRDPWVDEDPQPDAFDKRVGDGSWGPDDDILGVGTVAATANAGSDFAWAAFNVMNPARGIFHFGNLAQIRYSYAAYPGYGLPSEDGTGLMPVYTATMNDLLWAEGLARTGDLAGAATLINKTRVTRGGLSTLTAGSGSAAIIKAALYEQEIELLGLGASPFWIRRRVTPEGYQVGQACPGVLCLWQQTPREMPVPGKELGVLQQEFYTFGGPLLGDCGTTECGTASAASLSRSGDKVWSVREHGDALIKQQLQMSKKRRRF
jgi:hypothetical protein